MLVDVLMDERPLNELANTLEDGSNAANVIQPLAGARGVKRVGGSVGLVGKGSGQDAAAFADDGGAFRRRFWAHGGQQVVRIGRLRRGLRDRLVLGWLPGSFARGFA